MKTVEMSVDGMHCEACVSRVRKALEDVSGVREARVSLDQRNAAVEAEEDTAEDALVRAVDDAGYSASLPSAGGA